MAVGVGMIGRDITLTVGGSTLLGVVDKAVARTGTLLETTDDQSGGNVEYLAEHGTKSSTLSVSGTFKNLEVVQTYFGVSLIVACVVTYPEGSTESFDAIIESVETSFPANELSTFSISMNSSGATTFVAGT